MLHAEHGVSSSLVRAAVVIVAGLAMTGTAIAQPAGEMRWQVSADNGATWNSGRTTLQSASPVLVRAVASWSGVPSGLGLGGTMFDVTISNAGQADGARDFVRALTFVQQTIAATRLANNVIKIDDDRDTRPPGLDRFGVNVAQEIPVVGNFNSANPLTLFTFALDVDASVGVRRVSSVFQPSFPDVAFAIFTTPTGGQVRIPIASIAVVPAEVEIVPAPGAAAVLTLAGIAAVRRRRR